MSTDEEKERLEEKDDWIIGAFIGVLVFFILAVAAVEGTKIVLNVAECEEVLEDLKTP